MDHLQRDWPRGVGHADPKTYDTIHAANTCRLIVWHATCFKHRVLDAAAFWNHGIFPKVAAILQYDLLQVDSIALIAAGS